MGGERGEQSLIEDMDLTKFRLSSNQGLHFGTRPGLHLTINNYTGSLSPMPAHGLLP